MFGLWSTTKVVKYSQIAQIINTSTRFDDSFKFKCWLFKLPKPSNEKNSAW